MIRTNDTNSGNSIKRLSGRVGDRQPSTLGFKRNKGTYVATGGEVSINLALLTNPIAYMPGQNQISVKRSSGGSLMSTDFQELTSTSIGFSGDPLIAGEIVEITQEFSVTGVYAMAPAVQAYTATATAGQTLITCDFSWPINMNPSKALGAVWVEINGVSLSRGVDFIEVNLGTANTNQIDISLSGALIGGENIIITPVYTPYDTSAAQSSFNGQALQNLQNLMTVGTQGFVDTSALISVPNTTIVNRAKIPDLANDLRASLGVERIMTQSIVQLQNEFGLNGEPVFAALNDDRGLIRFVGSGWGSYVNNTGNSTVTGIVNNYVEITFYGTGLNFLSNLYSIGWGTSAIVDGGSSFVVIPTAASYPATLLNGRNTSSNQVVSVISGLTLGVHTVKLFNTQDGNYTVVYGFEILNGNASGLVNINPGVGYLNGQKYVNSLVDSVAYNAGVTGTRGGRVVRYLNADGTVGQVFTAVDAAAAYLASANHANEEVVRPYHWREFGAGRGDDFSLLATARVAAFTLDDGTTTLVGSNALSTTVNSLECLGTSGLNSFITFTFVGSGVDIKAQNSSFSGTYTYSIDGGSPLTIVFSTGTTKVVSGLSYGTHTLKLTITAFTSGTLGFQGFIVYQPKKPTLPATALEICDYNVMADLVANSTAGIETISQGVLRKEISQREAVYVGAGWAAPTIYPATAVGGWQTYTGTTTQYVEYTFFGTGFEARSYSQSASTLTVQVDGAFPSAVAYYGGFNGYTSGTGALTSNASTAGSGFRVVGLALGVHKVRVTLAAGTYIYTEALDIITPIHSYKSNLYADLQNTLPVGSCSMTDSRKTSLIKEILPAQKAFAQAIGVTASPTTNVTSFIPVPDMSCTIKTSGGPLEVSYSIDCSNATSGASDNTGFQIYVDGLAVGSLRAPCPSTAGRALLSADTVIVPCAAGTHTVALYWAIGNGTVSTAIATRRDLVVREI